MQPNEPHLLLNQTTALTNSIPSLIPPVANKSIAYTDDELVESSESFRRFLSPALGSRIKLKLFIDVCELIGVGQV